MKVSFRWLQQYVGVDVEATEVRDILTNTGLEVGGMERVEKYPGGLEGLVVGEVKHVEKHPNDDRLVLTKVDVGNGREQSIVCGAPNVAVGQKVIVALPGTTLYPVKGESFVIKEGKIRGEVSEGMICAEDEIGIGEDHSGIMILDPSAVNGKLLRDHWKLVEDTSFEIDLTPNRTDAICHFGVARDVISVLNLKKNESRPLQIPSVEAFKKDNDSLRIDVKVEDALACPRYSGVTMTGVKVGPSPEWLQDRLTAIGLHPINNIVDLANFVMYETGQPMHVFDADQIRGKQVVVRTVNAGTKFTTLDEADRELGSEDLMICDAEGPMCIAGVFGGLHSGVSDKTQNIFIESAYFNASSIRKTARRHGLSTDASYRYERGANPEATVYALKRLAILIKEEAGGLISSDVVDVYPQEIKRKEITFSLEYLHRTTGQPIPASAVENILNSLGFEVKKKEQGQYQLIVPPYRVEVSREIDVVEEVLRIFGFNQVEIPDRMMSSMATGETSRLMELRSATAELLRSNGWREIMNNSLTSERYYSADNLVELLNPLSKELSVMRPSLLEGGLESLRYNINRNSDDLKFFEFGTVYSKSPDKNGFVEERKLAVWMTGQKQGESWQHASQSVDFFDVKTIIHLIFQRFGLNRNHWKVDELQDARFEHGLSYRAQGKSLVVMGKVDESVLNFIDLEQDVFYAEIDWSTLQALVLDQQVHFEPIPKFPSIRRDLALLVDLAVQYAEIEKEARGLGGKILRDVNLFDIYQGKGVEEGKKSYAVSLVFQDDQKTLTDKQIDQVMEKIVKRLGEIVGAKLR